MFLKGELRCRRVNNTWLLAIYKYYWLGIVLPTFRVTDLAAYGICLQLIKFFCRKIAALRKQGAEESVVFFEADFPG